MARRMSTSQLAKGASRSVKHRRNTDEVYKELGNTKAGVWLVLFIGACMLIGMTGVFH